jgi:phosphopantetheinyl transferase
MIYLFDEFDSVSDYIFEKFYECLPPFRKREVDALVFRKNKLESLVSYWLLATSLGFAPGKFVYGQYKKPYLVYVPSNYNKQIQKNYKDDAPHIGKTIHFNMSHTEKLVAVIISDSSAVGIDVEKIMPFSSNAEMFALADIAFTKAEIAQIKASALCENATPSASATSGTSANLGTNTTSDTNTNLGTSAASDTSASATSDTSANLTLPCHEVDYFYKLWTLKEAYVKTLGVGMHTDLKAISFTAKSLHDKTPTLKLLDHKNGHVVSEKTCEEWKFLSVSISGAECARTQGAESVCTQGAESVCTSGIKSAHTSGGKYYLAACSKNEGDFEIKSVSLAELLTHPFS